ncbi:hypothetical protein MP228_011748 [Amoeboaphelidium protococcarum]|nr:hypothetical protein MP228_011748 [Amoeboaphelidium protococcarum]
MYVNYLFKRQSGPGNHLLVLLARCNARQTLVYQSNDLEAPFVIMTREALVDSVPGRVSTRLLRPFPVQYPLADHLRAQFAASHRLHQNLFGTQSDACFICDQEIAPADMPQSQPQNERYQLFANAQVHTGRRVSDAAENNAGVSSADDNQNRPNSNSSSRGRSAYGQNSTPILQVTAYFRRLCRRHIPGVSALESYLRLQGLSARVGDNYTNRKVTTFFQMLRFQLGHNPRVSAVSNVRSVAAFFCNDDNFHPMTNHLLSLLNSTCSTKASDLRAIYQYFETVPIPPLFERILRRCLQRLRAIDLTSDLVAWQEQRPRITRLDEHCSRIANIQTVSSVYIGILICFMVTKGYCYRSHEYLSMTVDNIVLDGDTWKALIPYNKNSSRQGRVRVLVFPNLLRVVIQRYVDWRRGVSPNGPLLILNSQLPVLPATDTWLTRTTRKICIARHPRFTAATPMLLRFLQSVFIWNKYKFSKISNDER